MSKNDRTNPTTYINYNKLRTSMKQNLTVPRMYAKSIDPFLSQRVAFISILKKNQQLIGRSSNGRGQYSKAFCIFETDFLLLLEGLLTGRIVNEIRTLLLQYGHEMLADEQTVQKTILDVIVLDSSDEFHIVLGIDVVSLELHLYLDGTVCLDDGLLDYFSKGLDESYLGLVYTVPFVLCVRDLEIFPVLRLLTRVLLQSGQDLVDQKRDLEKSRVINEISQRIKAFSKVGDRPPHEFGNVLEGQYVDSRCRDLCLDLLPAFQRVLDEFLRSNPLSVLDRQHPLDEDLQVLTDGHVVGEAEDCVIDETDQFGDGTLFVGTQTIEHFVQNYSKRPNISPDIVDQSLEDFRSHVDGRADHGLRHVALLEEFLAEAKISKFDNSIVEEDIRRLQISMEDVLRIQCLECILELPEDLDGLLLSEPSFGLDVFSQSSTVTELIDEVVVVGSPEHLDELDDVDVVDLGEDGDFVVGELAQFGRVLELLDVHHLDRVDQLVLPVLGLVDVAVLTLTDLLQQHVVLDYFVHL